MRDVSVSIITVFILCYLGMAFNTLHIDARLWMENERVDVVMGTFAITLIWNLIACIVLAEKSAKK